MSSPFFIIGNPRSGTSLLRLMLTCHPAITVPPECGYIQWLYEKYANVGWDDCVVYEEFVDDLFGCRKFDTWHMQKYEVLQDMHRLRPLSYAEVCQTVVITYQRRQSKCAKVFGDKNNYYLNYIDLLRKIYPNCRFVHIVRDGRDVACSYLELASKATHSKYAPRLPSRIDLIAEEWTKNVAKIRQRFSRLTEDCYLDIRFDHLLHAPERTLSEICQFLGLDYDSKMEMFSSTNRALELEPVEMLGWKENTRHPLMPEKVGRYTTELSGDDLAKFEDIAYSELEYYGFVSGVDCG